MHCTRKKKYLGAGNVSGLEMSQCWTCLRARLVQVLQGQICLRAGLVSRLDFSNQFEAESLGPEVFRGQTCFLVGLASRLEVSWSPKKVLDCKEKEQDGIRNSNRHSLLIYILVFKHLIKNSV